MNGWEGARTKDFGSSRPRTRKQRTRRQRTRRQRTRRQRTRGVGMMIVIRMKMNIKIEPGIEPRKGRDKDWYGDSWR